MSALVDNRQDMVEKRDVGRQLGVFVQVHREVKGPTSDTCVLVCDKFSCGDVSEMREDSYNVVTRNEMRHVGNERRYIRYFRRDVDGRCWGDVVSNSKSLSCITSSLLHRCVRYVKTSPVERVSENGINDLVDGWVFLADAPLVGEITNDGCGGRVWWQTTQDLSTPLCFPVLCQLLRCRFRMMNSSRWIGCVLLLPRLWRCSLAIGWRRTTLWHDCLRI